MLSLVSGAGTVDTRGSLGGVASEEGILVDDEDVATALVDCVSGAEAARRARRESGSRGMFRRWVMDEQCLDLDAIGGCKLTQRDRHLRRLCVPLWYECVRRVEMR